MKIFRSAPFLGLAFGDRTIRAAQVAADGTVTRAAEFEIPAGSPDDPDGAGDALRDFLRANRFTASRAVAGVPARWLLARGRELPPMTPALAGEALRMGAERDLSIDLEDLVLDFAGETDGREAARVLLVAILGTHLDRVVRTCRAAGLRLVAVTSSALTLARAAGGDFRDGVLISRTGGSAEILVQKDGRPMALRHFALDGAAPLGPGPGVPGRLAGAGNEIRREVALMPGGPGPGELFLGDGIEPEVAGPLGDLVGLPVRTCGLDAIGVTPGPEDGDAAAAGITAAALALAGARRSLLAVDFLHSRCAPPRRSRWGRKALATTALAAAAVLAGLLLVLDLERREADLAALKERYDGMKADIGEAQSFVASNKSLVVDWYEARPHPLDLLARVTQAFPEEGRVWATSFSATEGRKGTLAGKAVDSKSVLSVLDRLKADASLSDVMCSDLRDAGGGAKVVSFTLSFTYRVPE